MIDELIVTDDINTKYQLLQTIGEGAYAVVRRARHIEEDGIYAIKCIHKKHVSSQDLQAYMNESIILLKLQHPNIIQIFQIYNNPQYFYIVMEYMEGGQLCHPTNAKWWSSQAKICQIVSSITDALDSCHQRGIVHRDIKPQNILWSSKQQDIATLKIADFGFAKMTGGNTMTTACGTPYFFAPQILQGKPYDQAVDFWSLGVITYILLSGCPPFFQRDQSTLYQMIKRSPIPFPQLQWKYISCPAKDFIIKLLQRNPKKRYRADQIRNHPWIQSDHDQGVIYRQRSDNIKSYYATTKATTLRFIVQKTIEDMAEDGEEINDEQVSQMIDA